MKKIICIVLSAVMILSLAACGAKTEGKAADSMSLEEIFENILDGVENLPQLVNTEPNAENYHYYLFIDPIEGAQALACDAAINAISHSAVLLRVPENVDVAAVAEEIEQNADLNKWICTGAEKKLVKVHGRTILLVMSSAETTDAIAANFDKLWE